MMPTAAVSRQTTRSMWFFRPQLDCATWPRSALLRPTFDDLPKDGQVAGVGFGTGGSRTPPGGVAFASLVAGTGPAASGRELSHEHVGVHSSNDEPGVDAGLVEHESQPSLVVCRTIGEELAIRQSRVHAASDLERRAALRI